jgi:hypothetical protein
MKIVGAGVESTTLQLVPAHQADKHFYAVGHALGVGSPAQPNRMDFLEVSELTIDCNLTVPATSPAACGAIRVMGHYVLVRRVKVKNWGTNSSGISGIPCYVISMITAAPDSNEYEVLDPGIEQCLAMEPAMSAVGAKINVLHAGAKDDTPRLAEAYGRGPYIRNCFVDCGTVSLPASGPEIRALSMGWCRAGVVEGNQVHNVTYGGPYLEKQSARDIIVRNNFYRNVLKGLFWNLGTMFPDPDPGGAITSIVPVTGLPSGVPPQMEATTDSTSFPLSAGERIKIFKDPPDNFDGVFRIKSVIPPIGEEIYYKFRYEVPSVPSGTFSSHTWKKVFGVGRLIIEGNVIEMPADTSAIVGIHLHDQALDGQSPDHACGDVIIRDNKIRYLDGLAEEGSTGSGIEVNGAKNLLVRNNLIDVTPVNPLRNERCRSVTYFNNRNFADEVPGTPLIQGVNWETGRKYDELETEAEDAFVLAFMNRK